MTLVAAVLVSIWAIGYAAPATAACVASTPKWEQMEYREVVAISEAMRRDVLVVKLADEAPEWAAGFQHVCPDVIAKAPMLFDFKRLRRGAFHMHNVYAPLDIGFIDKNGTLFELQRMEPYILGSTGAGRTYRPSRPYVAALEARSGFFSEHRLLEGHTKIMLLD